MKRAIILLLACLALSACKKGGCENGGRVVGKWEHEYQTHRRVGKISTTEKHHDFVLALQVEREKPAECPVSFKEWRRRPLGSVVPPEVRP